MRVKYFPIYVYQNVPTAQTPHQQPKYPERPSIRTKPN